jgi:excisionase family DNA binding protein
LYTCEDRNKQEGGIAMTGKIYTVKEVQELLGLSERTIFNLLKRDELKGFKAGREWRFTEGDIQDYINRQRYKAEAAKKKMWTSKAVA